MGIPRFASWIFNNRSRNLTVPYIPKNVCSLSFDVNSIIHGCAQIVYNYGEWTSEQRKTTISEMSEEQLENELFKLITDTIFRIVTRVQPKKYLVLAVDGVAPLAKIHQQRGRRYRSVMSSSQEMRFDPNCITPGTDFMFRLDEHFRKWIQNNIQNLPEKILYSNHMVPGEGEQKIFDYVRSYEISGYGSHIIYGLDADLIILSLISRLKGVYLLREKSLEQNKYERLIVIDEVREYLYERMCTDSAIDDFAILSFFLGNDFIPTPPMFCGDMYDTIEYLLDRYERLGLSFINKSEPGCIVMKHLKKFIDILMEDESERLVKVSLHPPKLGFKTLEMATESYLYHGKMKVILNKEEFQKNWYTKIFSPMIEKSDMAFDLPSSMYLELFEPTNQKIEDLVDDYIRAFCWTYLYYKKGTFSIDPNFFYVCGYAPLMMDVSKKFPVDIKRVDREGSETSKSFTVLHQLLSVLPPKSMNIIPKVLHPFYKPDSKIADMFPLKVGIDTEAKDMERLGVVLMPPVDPMRLLGLDFAIEDMKKYESQKSMKFDRMSEDMGMNKRIEHSVIEKKEIPVEVSKSKFIQEFERLKRLRRLNDTNEKFK
jgi:5'-3' exoribonuclease 1